MDALSRRDVLNRTTLAGTAWMLGTGSASEASLQPNPPSGAGRSAKVIVTGGHPGDPEYGCGGTIARLTELGHEVVLLYLNRGEWPPRDPGTARVAEAAKACEILKARPAYAGQFNSQAVVDQAQYESFRKILDAEKPDVVFTHWPIDNHADHRAIFMLVYDAWLKLARRFALYFYEVSTVRTRFSFRQPIM
jgi:LmbE family N-acetylglucosaminyl deacetylase